MIIYLNQSNKTMWHSKEYCEQDLRESFGESWGDDEDNQSSIFSNALNVCDALKDNDYIHAGQAVQCMMQVYNDAWDEFHNKYYAIEEGSDEQIEKEIDALCTMGYEWGDEEGMNNPPFLTLTFNVLDSFSNFENFFEKSIDFFLNL